MPQNSNEFIDCQHCQSRNPIGQVICAKCGLPVLWKVRQSEDPLFHPGDLVDSDCRILVQLGEHDGIQTYLAIGVEKQAHYLFRVARKVSGDDDRILDDDTVVATVDHETASCLPQLTSDHGVRSLRIERDVLEDQPSASLPKLLQHVETDQYFGLIESLATGVPLLKAWQSGRYSPTRKCNWVEQLRQMFTLLHRRHCVVTGMELDRLLINEDGQLQIRDIGGLAAVPSRGREKAASDFYTAPELSASDRLVDYRADAYCLGAIICALHLQRELREDDFIGPGIPRPLVELLPDAVPPLIRLLNKTFTAKPEARFPTQGKQAVDPGGFNEIGEALGEYARAMHSVRLQISGWSTTGLVREHNEDAFTVSHLTTGAMDFRRDIALICVADGMGGHAAGEVASAVAVSAVAEYLRTRGLSSALTQNFGKNHPFHDIRRCAELLEEAVQEANHQVKAMADADSERTAMGCTLEAVLIVGRHAVISHVGDSRVYLASSNGVKQITQDQTLVNRLVELGRLSPQQAAIHPRRAELSQAVGVHKKVVPSRYFLDLTEGDWLIICSDGLSNHATIADITNVLNGCEDSESAARKLINFAICQGGSDNATAVVVRVL